LQQGLDSKWVICPSGKSPNFRLGLRSGALINQAWCGLIDVRCASIATKFRIVPK
jgi:hypothetical protein